MTQTRCTPPTHGLALLLAAVSALGCGADGGDRAGARADRPPAGEAGGPPAAYPAEVPGTWDAVSLPPAEVLVRWGACPFECCVYGRWRADSARTARVEPRGDAPEAFTLPADRPFHAITGQVRITRLQRVTFADTIRPDAASNVFTWTPADTLYALDYQGEGYQAVWHRDGVKSEFAFWSDTTLPVRVDGRSETVWWAQVADSTGRAGWIDMGHGAGRVHGADACGGPSGIPADWTGSWVPWTSPGGTFAIEVPSGWSAFPRSRWDEKGPLPSGVVEEVAFRTPRLGLGAIVTVRSAATPDEERPMPLLGGVNALERRYEIRAPRPAAADSARVNAVLERFVRSLRPLPGPASGGSGRSGGPGGPGGS